MNISKTKGSIPVTFDYSFTDAEGNDRSEPVSINIKRMSFRESVSKDFQEAAKKVDTDQTELANLLCSVIESWDITESDAEGNEVPFAITADNLLDNTTGAFVAQLAEAVMEKLVPKSRTAKA